MRDVPIKYRLTPEDIAPVYAKAAQELVDYAEKHGVLITITQVPRQPLAMGNYETVVSTRTKRELTK